MTKKQKALLDTVPAKKHDPDGVTVKMVMEKTGWRQAHAGRFLREKIERGEALPCWYRDGGKWVKAMKAK